MHSARDERYAAGNDRHRCSSERDELTRDRRIVSRSGSGCTLHFARQRRRRRQRVRGRHVRLGLHPERQHPARLQRSRHARRRDDRGRGEQRDWRHGRQLGRLDHGAARRDRRRQPARRGHPQLHQLRVRERRRRRERQLRRRRVQHVGFQRDQVGAVRRHPVRLRGRERRHGPRRHGCPEQLLPVRVPPARRAAQTQ